MTCITFYFQAHQPRRLKKAWDSNDLFDDALDKAILEKVATKCYLPANSLFAKLVREHENFRICLSVTGTLLEQARRFLPKLVDSFAELGQLARDTGRIEFLAETYYHSLTGLFRGGNKGAFIDQIVQHKQLIEDLLGVSPTSFRNTELLFNNSIADIVANLGFKSILCEKRDDIVRGHSPNAVFQNRSGALKVLPRNFGLSDELAFRFTHRHFTADDFARWISQIDGEAVLIGMDYEAIGEHQWEDTGIFDFWTHLPRAIEKQPSIVMKNPSETADLFGKCPTVSVDDLATSSWADEGRNTNAWLGNKAQRDLFFRYEDIESKIKLKGDEALLDAWRHLGTSDHFYYMCTTRHGADGGVHDYFSHFADATEAVMVYTHALSQIHRQHIRRTPHTGLKRKSRRPRILLVTPEVTELPEGAGNLSNVVHVKGGGLADISAALVAELMRMGLDVHIALPKYERQMLEYSRISQQELDRLMGIFKGARRIHLVQDSAFAHLQQIYEHIGGNTSLNRAIVFQRVVINSVLSEAMPSHGKMLVHCNDWMTGLIPAAAKDRGFKTLFTVHNIHSGKQTLRQLEGNGIDVARFFHELYLDAHPDYVESAWESVPVDFLLSGIKSAHFVNTVSPTFLLEIVNGYFPEVISDRVREEFQAKYKAGAAMGILNAPKSSVDPSVAMGLSVNYNKTNFEEGKRANKLAFQEKLGLEINPHAPLFFWPHRLYQQKGPDLLADVSLALIDFYREDGLQVAIVGNGDPRWERAFGSLACGSNGKIAYAPFEESLSELGKAAADFIVMPSLYEPCGLPQMEGMRYGTLPVVRATGGLKDSVQHLNIANDTGNGFVFNDYTPDAFWWACSEAMKFYRRETSIKHRIIQRVMEEGRSLFNLERTTLEYIKIYEKLLGEKLI